MLSVAPRGHYTLRPVHDPGGAQHGGCQLESRIQLQRNRGIFFLEVNSDVHHRANTSCPIRRAAISQYFSSSSMPMAFRPKSLAARSVVPEPMKGSRMVSPSSVNKAMISFISG